MFEVRPMNAALLVTFVVRKSSELEYILVPLYEGIESRKTTRRRRRSGNCARIEFARSAGRSARINGPKRLRKKHAGQGFGRASRLSGTVGNDLDGWRKRPGTRARRTSTARSF